MAMWADNVKFVKDIIDSKYQKIDSAIAEVIMEDDVLKAFESLAKRWKESQLKFLRDNFCNMYMSFSNISGNWGSLKAIKMEFAPV